VLLRRPSWGEGEPDAMRRTIVLIVTLCLLGAGAPAGAQTADPLGLIASGALVPYVGSGRLKGEMSILEIASPVGSNAPPEDTIFGPRPLHMFFFDGACTRSGPSVSLPLTVNDVDRVRLDFALGVPDSGLVAIASSDTGFELRPLSNPIHARVLWIHPGQDFVRILEPIALANAEAVDTSQVWNPLRTAATFHAPLDRGNTRSTLVLICPTANIITAAFPSTFFPELVPPPAASGSTPLRMRVYNDEELFVRNIVTTCDCLSQIPLRSLDPVYSDLRVAPRGTYTEILGGAADDAPVSLTGYLATRAGGRDAFSRLSGGSASSIQGSLAPGVR
jgi:hypothetical protein